jgi:hypothetical protein
MRPLASAAAAGSGSPRLLLRSATVVGSAPTRVHRVDPTDGQSGVLRDSPVLVWLTAPVAPGAVSADQLRVRGPEGDVPGRVETTSNGLLLIWRAERLLVPGAAHFVVISGLRDVRGREITAHLSRFTPCEFVREDISG